MRSAAGFDDVKTALALGHADLVNTLRAFTDAAREIEEAQALLAALAEANHA